MAREARLFDSANGSPARAMLKMQVNIPPNWIGRARRSRKNLEPDLVASMTRLQRLTKRRPNARATIRAARLELRRRLNVWETAYRKESFYNGLRALLEISRAGKTRR